MTSMGVGNASFLCFCLIIIHRVRKGHCLRACSGINFTSVSTGTPFNSASKNQQKF